MAKFAGLTKAFNKCKVFCSKNSPFILVTGGVTLMVAGAVVACKETLKTEEILDTHLEYKEKIDGNGAVLSIKVSAAASRSRPGARRCQRRNMT